MKAVINAYLSVNEVKEIQTKSFGDLPNALDRIAIGDNIGNVLQLDAGILHKGLVALSAARNLTIDQYLSKFKTVVDKEFEGAKNDK
jgi:hypothetical protein